MGGHAWVTLATNDSYSLGALVLAHSLKQVGTQQQLAVLITPGVTGSMRTKLSEVFNVVVEVNLLDSKDETNLRLLKRPELGVTFTKLHCWRLTQFDKCVFLDADTLVLENCDELFDREELSAAPDIGWPDCFNSGVFVFRPSMETYEKLTQFALERGSFDGGDQGLLNLYFSDWAHKDISKHLPFIYNMASTACYSYLPAFKQFGKNAKIIHFIGASKPWLQYFDTETRKVHPAEGVKHLQEILQLWWNIFCNLIHPSLSPEMTSHTDTVHGSQSRPSQIHPTNDSNPAEDYQKVWDPWEEYDSKRESNHETSISNAYKTPQTPSQSSDNQHINNEIHQTHHNNQSLPVEYHNIQSGPVEHHHIQIDHPGEHHHIQIEHHNIQSRSSEHHSNQSGPDEHHNIQNPHFDHNFHHQSGQQEHIESHNTNACIEADNHYHDHPSPVHSQPQPPVLVPLEEPRFSTKQPPPNDPPAPTLPDECMATTTVSNEMTLHTDSKEDSNENNAGLAGAFAKLTLGSPRTSEQQALDDHLRRQGWEVGNIDYLGRDSFDNIWNKICQTLSSAPEQTATIKEPSSPTVESKPVGDLPPVEVKSDEQSMDVASSEVQPVKQVVEAEPAEILPRITQAQVAQPQQSACDQISVTEQIKQMEAVKLADPKELKTEAQAAELPSAPAIEAVEVPQGPKVAPAPAETPAKVVPTPTVETQPAAASDIPAASLPVQPTSLSTTKVQSPIAPITPELEPPPVPPTPIADSKPIAIESPSPATPVVPLETSKPTPEQPAKVDIPAPASVIPQPAQSPPQPEQAPVAPAPSPAEAPVKKATEKLSEQAPVAPLPPPSEAPVIKTVEQLPEQAPVAAAPPPAEASAKKSAEKLHEQAPVAAAPPLAAAAPPTAEAPAKKSAEKLPEQAPVAPAVCPAKKTVEKLDISAAAPSEPAAPKVASAPAPSPPVSLDKPLPEQVKGAKGALKVETTVPATQTSSGPTPPPRKSSGGTKKATKPKK